MMSPVYLNPPPSSFPAVEMKEEQLFLSPHLNHTHNTAAASISSPTAFFTTTQEHQQHDHRQVGNYKIDDRWGDNYKLLSSSSLQKVENDLKCNYVHKLSWSIRRDHGDNCEGKGNNEEDGTVKWKPSKMKLVRKTINSSNCPEADNKPAKFALNLQDHPHSQNNKDTNITSSSRSNVDTIRVCADCNTTTTPLWRSGPRGPKSLCNACGIRQRKARRAMEAAAAAANGTIATETSYTKTTNKVHNKEKKSRIAGHAAQSKKLCKPPDQTHQIQEKLCFKNLALSLSKNPALQRVFPQDVEEAAILLMELSCGFVHG
uniref:Putative GATA transcription factor 22 n=1 Tax=Rhizophora mucronata TaxID=61149 RepID=A0A2P2NG94_RHIMU